jgi:hypothetical protein
MWGVKWLEGLEYFPVAIGFDAPYRCDKLSESVCLWDLDELFSFGLAVN